MGQITINGSWPFKKEFDPKLVCHPPLPLAFDEFVERGVDEAAERLGESPVEWKTVIVYLIIKPLFPQSEATIAL
jgi:hypothetical protein